MTGVVIPDVGAIYRFVVAQSVAGVNHIRDRMVFRCHWMADVIALCAGTDALSMGETAAGYANTHQSGRAGAIVCSHQTGRRLHSWTRILSMGGVGAATKWQLDLHRDMPILDCLLCPGGIRDLGEGAFSWIKWDSK